MLDAIAHENVPFEEVVDSLDLEKDLSRTPVFQVLFAYQNLPAGELALPGVRATRYHFDRTSTPFDLSTYVFPEHNDS